MTSLQAECPVPGFYPAVPFDQYWSWPAVNHSKLLRIDKSPLNAKMPEDLKDKKAIKFGQLVHCGRLEPTAIQKRYAVMPAYELHQDNRTDKGAPSTSVATNYVKDRRAWFMQQVEASGKTVVSTDDFQKLQDTLSAILRSERAVECLTGGDAELSIVWQDKITGLMCKCRIDYRRPDRLTDLKTSRDSFSGPLGPSFDWSLWTYSYYSQAAWYQEGWRALTGDTLPFWFAVVSNEYPIQCIAAPVGEATLAAGRKSNLERMKIMEECESTGQWPGYESPELFELPDKYLDSEVQL